MYHSQTVIIWNWIILIFGLFGLFFSGTIIYTINVHTFDYLKSWLSRLLSPVPWVQIFEVQPYGASG